MEAAESEEGDIGEDERKLRGLEGKKGGINQDLMRETGSYGYSSGMQDFYGGSGGPRQGPSQAKMALLMGYTHLNTIEEEKHETQTSNYFREIGETSERDDSNANQTNVRGSRILDDMELNNSGGSKISPNRHDN